MFDGLSEAKDVMVTTQIKYRPLTFCNFPSASFRNCRFIYRLHRYFYEWNFKA